MTTTFPTEEMIMERGAALVRMAKLQRLEDAKLRREVDAPIWRDWVFWLGVILMFGEPPSWISGLIAMVVALDRTARKRSRAARELNERQPK